ncbi:alpha/beta fold hydrolase [Aeromonas hydrophila]|uniref:alpha/beta fold hydrolase n=1 Tax=Aeromonas hydrophila TaxID=644 RepID=UPI003EC63C8E
MLWNGERVFASEGDASSWQSKALTLTASEGRNTLVFRGIGESNGLGYLLDNVVATASGKAEIGQVSAQLAQDDNAARARGDQASADADKQRLEQEKGQQLAAIAGTQAQLEATDQHKLAQNGQDQRAAIEAESREMTAQLDTLARRFEQVSASDAASEPSGQHWRTGFADRLLSTVQEDLDDAGNTAGTAIEEARSRHEAQHQQLDTALAKSKTGQQRSEQLQGDAEAAGQHRAAQAEQRRLDALVRQGEATSRQQQGEASASQAQLAGEQAASQAGLQANQAKQNAASLKQSGDKPTRQGVQSGPSTAAGQPLLQTGELDVPAVGTLSAPDEVPSSAIESATGLSEQEQSALDGALAAVNRLQINAGSRQPVAPTTTSTSTPSQVQEEVQATATATKPAQQHEVLATAAVDLTGLHGPRPGSKAVPEFSSHFDGSSIGIENELTGLVVALPKNSAQKFGYVHDAAGKPLFMLTKDMNQGGYTNPAGISDVKGINQWQTHTIELVTYPSEMQDQQAVEARKEAMLWLAREFTQHISQTNHTRLSDLVSEDGRFTLVISNANHVIAAGNGAARDGQGQTIGMTPSGQQATVAVSAKEFGSGSSQEIRLLESAPWYHPELKDLLLSNTANVQWEDAATAQNVFAYLTSIYGKTADLAREYGIHINDWDPLAEGITPNAQGLTDPKVKNAWEILPRTKPVAMLALLSAHDRKLVSEQILATLKSAYSPALAQNIYDYFKFGGEVAGHGINNATTGDSKHPEPAILFEFRQVPNELSQFVPKSESTARVEVKTLDQFDPVSRRTIVAAVNNLVEQSADFDSWYQAYRERQGLPPVKNAKKVASANHKAEWVMANHAEAWSQLTAEHQAEVTSGLQALGGHKPGDQSPGVANADTAPLDKQPLNPLTRFLNDNLYGTRDERRQVGDITRQLLDHAVSKGEAERVTLQGDAGRLSGYLHKGAERPGTPQDGKPEVVLFLHGSGSSAEEQADAVRSHYQKQGVDMLAVNLRGYGTSDGGPSEQGVYQDARTMFRYLVEERGVAPGKILIHGYSMGGPIAADLARYAAEQGKPVGGLLLDRPMPSMSKAITAHELPNPGGLVGAIAKAVNGRFSVEKNLDGLPKSTPIMLLTDNEGLGSEGEKLRAKLAVAGYQVSGEQTFYGHLASNRLMSQYAEQIVGDLFNRTPPAADIEAPLKGIEGIRRDLKRYQEALAPQVGSNGATRDIRTTKAFLAGYQQGLAGKVVEGFQPDMSMTQLVDLFVQPTLSPQQQGALAWEIENRALKSTIKPRIEQSNRLFRDVASQGGTDPHAREHLAPQLLLLNLADDGFGGRCDPLSKLVLVAKQLESEGQPDLARRMMEKLYSAAAVINNPDRYSATELENARKLVGSLAEIHTNTPAAYNYDSLRSIKYDIVKEKWEGKNAISLDTVLTKLTAKGSDAPVLLELDAPGHAMAAWAKQGESGRIYGFYDPNAGIVEFSSAEKFSRYMTRFFGKEGLDMANGYHLKPGPDGKPLFFRVSEMNGAELARFKPSKDLANKVTLQEILQLPVFDESPMAELPGKTAVTERTAKLFADVYSPDELKKAAQVFAKPIGESYQQILDQLATLHGASGQAKIEAALRLNNLIDDYLVKHEGSGRNPALSKLQSQLHGNLYHGELASLQTEVTALAKIRPDLAAIVIGKAAEEAQGQHPGLTQMVLRWAAQDPYLAAKAGYQGAVPADLPFDARFHIALGEHHGDLKKWLTEAQGKGLLSRAVLDDTRKVLHLGYSYQELQDMTGEQSAQMAVYFIKEAAKQAAPGSELSAEHIMLDKFGDRRYLGELESRRIEQIENIYHSSKQADVAAWDARYGGDALRTLNAQLDGDSTLAGQLARLLDNRNGLLIGETHGSDVNGLRFVNEQMDALKAQGVTVIGLEHLRGELAQPLIDRYLAGGEMSPELATMLKSKHLEPSLFERARERGMRIVALDDGSTARPVIGGTEHGLMYRAGAANNVAVDVLGKLPAGEKFVAIYGSAHLASHKGIEGFVPGITHRLGLPALKVDADNRFHLQADDVSQRVEYADIGRKWTRRRAGWRGSAGSQPAGRAVAAT